MASPSRPSPPEDSDTTLRSAGPSSARSQPSRGWKRRWHRTEAMRRRLAVSGAAGSLAALVVALLDVLWARGAGEAPSSLSVIGADAGLLVPVTLLVGLAVGAASWIAHPVADPTVSGMLARLRQCGTGRPADIAALVPLAVLASFVWVVLSAQLARVLLSFEMVPWICGAVLAVGSVGIAVILSVLVLASTPLLRRTLATWRAGFARWVDPVFTLGVALGIVALLLSYGVVRGGLSGEGGLLGIFGVFKRQELDLRLAGSLLGLGVVVFVAPAMLAWLRGYQAWILALVPLVLTARSAVVLNTDVDLAQHIERRAPVGRPALKVLRRLTDGDADGASRWFSGGDCDDSNPAIHPMADEIADNGIDEDCSGSDLSLAGVATAAPSAGSASPSLASRLPKDGNLIFVVVDTLRWDVGYMGYERPITPNLDALAKRSAIFERAYSLASYTGKSVGPMLIGKYGSETHRNWGHFNRFGEEDVFVAQRLQKAGVRTLSVQGHRYFGKFGGLERGFDVIDLSAAPPEGAKWATDTTVTSVQMTDAAIGLLEKKENSSGRFFLYMQYLDPHADYLQHDDVPRFGAKARDLYDNEVAFTDKHLGRLLDFVAKQPWAGRTTIIVTSDHGEAFGENGMWRHGFELWEVLTRIPLVVYVPGIEPQRLKVRRSHIDLVPTMLQLMGLEPPEPKDATPEADFLSGVSLVPDLFPEKGKPPAVRDVLIDMPGGPYNEARRAFIHGDLKLIISRGANKELFDLSSDPKEEKNLWRQRRSEIEQPYAVAKSRLREIKVTGKPGN